MSFRTLPNRITNFLSNVFKCALFAKNHLPEPWLPALRLTAGKKLAFAIALLCVVAVPIKGLAQVYVNHAASGTNDGSSWENAYLSLSDALENANEGESVFVAQGIYTPGSDNSATFLIDKNIQLLGGYDAVTGVRNPQLHETILSGDLNIDDVEDDFAANRADNAWTVVVVSSSPDSVLIDGFTISHGHAVGQGGLLANGGGLRTGAPMQVSDCIFEQNFARNLGGGVAASNVPEGSLQFDHCIFRNNLSNRGGGADIRFVEEIRFIECTFTENTASATLGQQFEQNGGGVFTQNSNCYFRSCTFDNNEALEGDTDRGLAGGAMMYWVDANGENHTIEIDSCAFTNNTGGLGGILLQIWGKNQTSRLLNSTFADNQAVHDFAYGNIAIYHQLDGAFGDVQIENCHFEGNTSSYSSGALDIGSGPGALASRYQIKACTFLNNSAGFQSGALNLRAERNTEAEFLLEDCIFEGNQASERAGAMMWSLGSDDFSIGIDRCIFKDNESANGSAIVSFPDVLNPVEAESGVVEMENCLLTGNTGDGTAIWVDDMVGLDMLNCTVADNFTGAFEFSSGGSLLLQNNILANSGNIEYVGSAEAAVTSNGGNLIDDDSMADVAQDSDLQSTDPAFVAEGDPCTYFQLSEGSPAVNVGVSIDSASDTDACGNDRIRQGQVDIGALESPFLVVTQEVIAGQLDLFPNPTQSTVQIRLPDWPADGLLVKLYNAQGQLLRQQWLNEQDKIDVNGLSPGLYNLTTVEGNRMYIGPFIKL